MPMAVALLLFICMSFSARAFRHDELDKFESGNAVVEERQRAVGPREDVFSVMNVNTFLLEIRLGGHWWLGGGVVVLGKPNMQQRAAGLVEWFRTLLPKDVPDVVVFNEIFSKAGSSILKNLCTPSWKRNAAQIIACNSDSHFGFATRVLNPARRIKISGGVVIMVRKGLSLSDFAEESYSSHDLEDGMSQKGFLRVKVRDHKVGDVWVLGTHTQAWPKHADIRINQFKQMWEHIQNYIPTGEKVILAGDFNTETSELSTMKRELHASNSAITEAGFFMPLRTSLKYSTFGGGAQNALLHYDAHEFDATSPHDQILYVSKEANYAEPENMTWQYLPMKSKTCYETSLASSKTNIQIDDLSDHYAAYAEFCYGTNCASTELSGHHGYTGIHPNDKFRCCPGRGAIGERCFDWAPGGIKDGRIAYAEGKLKNSDKESDGYCTKATRGKTCPIVFGDEGKQKVLLASSLKECQEHLAELDLPFRLISTDCDLY